MNYHDDDDDINNNDCDADDGLSIFINPYIHLQPSSIHIINYIFRNISRNQSINQSINQTIKYAKIGYDEIVKMSSSSIQSINQSINTSTLLMLTFAL